MTDRDQRVLVLAPTGRDAELCCEILKGEGFVCESCATIDDLCASVTAGAAAVLIAEEALPSRALATLVQTIEAQPPWSDLPVIVMAGAEFSASTMRPINLVGPLRNLMVLERPVRRLILSRTVAVAIRSRQRQYEVRAHLEQRTALLERERAARADAEMANRMKDEFLMTISHELRTPLTAIYGWARMLTTGQIRENQTSRAIETIERNARAQLQLIEDLLDVSRAISGKLRLAIRPTDVHQIVLAVVESMKPAADGKDVRVAVSSKRHSAPIPADPERVQQIVWNLLSNAIKFTPAGGHVSIRVTAQATDVTIVVRDSGSGISPEFLPYVFDRFRQSDGGTTRHYGGLGLGLAIVRHLVELHGGTVYAESSGPGLGATFRVVLPKTLSPAVALAAANGDTSGEDHHRGLAARLNGIRVLVVDDDPSARELFEAIVQNAGGELKSAASVHEAVALLGNWWPDVLLSDIEMPDEDGYALMERVRELSSTQHASLAAIAVTAHSRPEDRARALEAGFHWHLSKPVEPSQLVAVLGSLTGRLEPSADSSNVTG